MLRTDCKPDRFVIQLTSIITHSQHNQSQQTEYRTVFKMSAESKVSLPSRMSYIFYKRAADL